MHALHLLDIDRFKTVNDTLGHYVGDQLLQSIAQRLKLLIDENTTLSRLGGDEFAFLQEGITDVSEAEALARRIVSTLSDPIDVARHRVNATASLGIALIGPHGQDVNEILKNADLAMYQAKSEGRNRYSVFAADLRARIKESSLLEAAMRDALARGEFVLHYQPQVDIASRRIAGVEALIRWQHPQRGLLSPAEFLSVAEETGLIAPISDGALPDGEAARQEHQVDGHRDDAPDIGYFRPPYQMRQKDHGRDKVEHGDQTRREGGFAVWHEEQREDQDCQRDAGTIERDLVLAIWAPAKPGRPFFDNHTQSSF